ncbi:glycosyltransferase family 2 protein, partial [Escherichia coli]|nr:glycosyltransferase family 2 protein [Escherichia coli]
MLYIAIVSHGHFEIINELNCISKLSALDDVQIIVKDNVGEIKLKEYCKKYNIMYFDDKKGLGFGANNNFIFNKICHDANDNDYFLVMNPDVFIECDELLKFKKNIDTNDYSCVTINLYKDYCYKQ